MASKSKKTSESNQKKTNITHLSAWESAECPQKKIKPCPVAPHQSCAVSSRDCDRRAPYLGCPRVPMGARWSKGDLPWNDVALMSLMGVDGIFYGNSIGFNGQIDGNSWDSHWIFHGIYWDLWRYNGIFLVSVSGDGMDIWWDFMGFNTDIPSNHGDKMGSTLQ